MTAGSERGRTNSEDYSFRLLDQDRAIAVAKLEEADLSVVLREEGRPAVGQENATAY